MSRDGARAPKRATSRSMGGYSPQFGLSGEATTPRDLVLDGGESDYFAGCRTALGDTQLALTQLGQAGRHSAPRQALRAPELRLFRADERTHDFRASRAHRRGPLP